jgi:hypothetical protein
MLTTKYMSLFDVIEKTFRDALDIDKEFDELNFLALFIIPVLANLRIAFLSGEEDYMESAAHVFKLIDEIAANGLPEAIQNCGCISCRMMRALAGNAEFSLLLRRFAGVVKERGIEKKKDSGWDFGLDYFLE